MRALGVFVFLAGVLACSSETYGAKPVAKARTAKPRHKHRRPSYKQLLVRIEHRRQKLRRRYLHARSKRQREKIRAQARRFVLDTIERRIFPAWLGTPWGMDRNSTATRPHQRGMTVACSYFITSVLQNAGLRLDSRYRFGQAPALYIQRSLAPKRADLQRYFSIPDARLAANIARHGDGLYIIGLVNHVGFVVVRHGKVRLVHSGYVPHADVIDEPLVGAQVIAISKRAGYFVTPLFHDDWLIDKWLRGEPVKFRRLGLKG